MLSVTGLRYRYGDRPVLDGVDLTVLPGEIVCLVGPNGAGKSTLLKCLNGILKPGAGEIAFGGRLLSSFGRRELARTLSYVPQQTGQAASLTVADMVALGRAPHRGLASPAQDQAVVLDCIEAMRLEPLALRLFGQLSGGERQRVLIARALTQEGRFMLLDEPTSDLDLRHQLETMVTLRQVASERGVGALVAIHDLALAGRFADRLVLMAGGRVHAEGTWQAVATPANLQAAYGVSALIGADQGLPYLIPVSSSLSTPPD